MDCFQLISSSYTFLSVCPTCTSYLMEITLKAESIRNLIHIGINGKEIIVGCSCGIIYFHKFRVAFLGTHFAYIFVTSSLANHMTNLTALHRICTGGSHVGFVCYLKEAPLSCLKFLGIFDRLNA